MRFRASPARTRRHRRFLYVSRSNDDHGAQKPAVTTYLMVDADRADSAAIPTVRSICSIYDGAEHPVLPSGDDRHRCIPFPMLEGAS
jgi:hypothetical protein